jgi:acetyltransferase-like isoleucine patch superfamily enzyme
MADSLIVSAVVLGIRKRLRARAIEFVQRHSQPPAVMRDPGDLLVMGEHAYFEPQLVKFGREPDLRPGWVTLAPYAGVARNVRILVGGGHHPEWVSVYALRIRDKLPGAYEDGQPQARGPVHIGSDTWVGFGTTIQSGVTIGDGAVVASNSHVVKDVPPYAIVGGNPAKLIRYRFDDDTIAALLRIRWWDWPHEKVLAEVDLLNGGAVADFVAKHDPGA